MIDGLAQPYEPGADLERRQDTLVPAFRQNGAIYALSSDRFLAERRFLLFPCLPYVMSREAGIDVDEELDLALAEAVLRQRGAP